MVSFSRIGITKSRRNWNRIWPCVRPFLAILVQQTCSSACCEGRIPEGLFVIRHLPQYETVASRRALLRGIASSASVLALGGCASLGATGARYDASSLSVEPTLIVATTRKAVNAGRTKPWFGPERATRMTVARAKLVAPDESRFSLAAAGLGDWRLDAVEPVAAEVGDLLGQGSGGSDVLIYVHGFKQTFETAVLDAAHLADGIKFRGQTMAFSWPSKAGFFDYAYDRESAMWSRDEFERVLNSVATSPGTGRMHIVAHSMGTMLTLESLRQLYARSGDSVADRIGAVVFASPDIDMDVFLPRLSGSAPSGGRSPSSPRQTTARWRCRRE